MNSKKIWNNQKKCYKIDIFVDGNYACSTNQSKTCKQAKERFIEQSLHYYTDRFIRAGKPIPTSIKITASFDKR